MFYYYEIRSYPLKSVELKEETCPLCKHKGKVELNILQKYMWMWGPMVPQNKYGLLECDACDAVIPADKWNDEVKGLYKIYKTQAKTPSRLWRGARVFLIFFIVIFSFAGLIKSGVLKENPFGFKNDAETMKQTSKLIKEVKEGSVLFAQVSIMKERANAIEATDSHYEIIKIERINGDKAFLRSYDKRYENFQDQYDIKIADLNEEKFSKEEIAVSLDQIKRNGNLMLPEKKGERFLGPFGSVKGIIK
jgi:hypothetical protein